MEDADFSDEFCRFLRAAVPTVDAAELLLLLSRERERWWAVQEAAGALAPGVSLSEADVARYFGVFQGSALLAVGPDNVFVGRLLQRNDPAGRKWQRYCLPAWVT